VYEEYFGLGEPAFRKTPDPRYLFPGEVHEEALERLVFAAEERELALLTGGVGTGKTLLTRALVDRLGDRYEVAMLLHPRLTPRQLLAAVAGELGVARPATRAVDLVGQLHERLLELDRAGRAALLIVDEAQLVPSRATFEELRLLTNFQLDDHGLIAVVLAGQPELRERLARSPYRALTQRIGAAFQLVPLSLAECAGYLRHRLAVAGATREIFTPPAARALHRASGGVPRVLNQLATQALLEAMARGVSEVDAAVADAVVADEAFLEPRSALVAVGGRHDRGQRAASGRRAR
jgi:type II secretory pathway predicted ATPase ExeA